MTYNPTLKNLGTTFAGIGKNRIINGEMIIDQLNGGTAVTVNDNNTFYSVDQFFGIGQLTDGVFTLQRQSATPPSNFSNYLRATCTTADASIGAGQRYLVVNKLEGYTVRDFGFGSSAAKVITLSFWVRSSLTGTYSGSFQNNAITRSYPFEYTISSANTWEKKSITLTADTTGTWEIAEVTGIRLFWSLAIGTTYQGTANTWAGVEYFGTSNQVNFMSSNSSRTWDITGIQLEVGSSATPFEYRPFQTEVQLCQRYYEKSYNLDIAPGTTDTADSERVVAGQVGTTTMVSHIIPFKIPKRATPTITLYRDNQTNATGVWRWDTVAGGTNAETTTTSAIRLRGFTVTESTNVEYVAYGNWTADARL